MRLTLQMFGNLKDYYESELEIETACERAADLREELVRRNKNARELLECCRFAIGDELISDDCRLYPQARILVFPPSSGG
ncbi:MAG: MoaD/ThiS family protein [Spirochaetales bacterium]|nr:MoaD/ThiS family protein [Leptospiraceae bacterium]MCP5481265.1 MoaD/ThiS family protein [Spirochaetales bacterium]MCP5485701.1 MoaD/ThiS family protein [Spirochaetales bacterium]